MKNFKNLISNNRGAGIVSVLIAISFLTTLGLIIMFASYISSEMKASERAGSEASRRAEAVVEEVRAGIETAVSDSIISCYADTMSNYSCYNTVVENKFDENFRKELFGWKAEYIDSTTGEIAVLGNNTLKRNLIVADGANYKYDVSVLEAMVVDKFGAQEVDVFYDPPVGFSSNSFGKATLDNASITFHDVHVKYKTADTLTDVTADIKIVFPDLGYVYENLSLGSIPNFAVIAKNELFQFTAGNTDNRATIRGNAYAGKINLYGSTNRLEVTNNSTLICNGDITVQGYYRSPSTEPNNTYSVNELIDCSRLFVDDSSTLWAKNINIKNNGIASFLYKTNIFNDLNMSGTSPKAVLRGEYYGFGNSVTNAAESSAILINNTSSKTVLNIQGLDKLTLAGFGFTGSSNVKMNNSLAYKRDQNAFLMPLANLECINEYDTFNMKTNPSVFDTPDEFTAEIAKVKVNGEKILGDKTAADYGISLKPVYANYAGKTMGFVFMTFDTNEHMAEYFRDYFTAHPEKISDFLNSNLDLSRTGALVKTVGTYYEVGSDGKIQLSDIDKTVASESLNDEITNKRNTFINYCKSLKSESTGEENADNPFDYYIDSAAIEAKLNELGTNLIEFKDDGGNVSAVISRNSYVYDGSNEHLRLIICLNNVEVQDDFTGLIMSAGTIEITANAVLTSSSESVKEAMKKAKGPDNILVKDFIKIDMNDEVNDMSVNGGTFWDLGTLVQIEKWKIY